MYFIEFIEIGFTDADLLKKSAKLDFEFEKQFFCFEFESIFVESADLLGLGYNMCWFKLVIFYIFEGACPG